MYKLFLLLAAIVSYVPLEVASDGKLQLLAEIAKTVKTNRFCEHDCTAVVNIDGTNLTFTLEVELNPDEDTDALCKCMLDYMKDGVGDATSECQVTDKQLTLAFRGEYNPKNIESLPPLATLANAMVNFEKPSFGGYEASKEISKKDGRIYIKLTYSGKDYKSACDGILAYLNQNKLLVDASSKCTEIDESEKLVVELLG